MQHPGWLLVAVGGVMLAVGLIWLLSPQIPWLGRLPGDIAYQGKSFRFYFPVVTCLLASALLSFMMWIVSRMR